MSPDCRGLRDPEEQGRGSQRCQRLGPLVLGDPAKQPGCSRNTAHTTASMNSHQNIHCTWQTHIVRQGNRFQMSVTSGRIKLLSKTMKSHSATGREGIHNLPATGNHAWLSIALWGHTAVLPEEEGNLPCSLPVSVNKPPRVRDQPAEAGSVCQASSIALESPVPQSLCFNRL